MSFFESYRESITTTLENIEATLTGGKKASVDDALEQLCKITHTLKKHTGSIYIIGNGASAMMGSHMALDWSKNGHVKMKPLNDPAFLTAIGNDIGYEDVFSAPLEWYARPADILVAISSSGNSPNIIKAIKMARKKEIDVVTFTGLKPDNQARQLGDINLYVPANTYGIVECTHQILLHLWLDRYCKICEWDQETPQDLRESKA